jgi:hypothetical protein
MREAPTIWAIALQPCPLARKYTGSVRDVGADFPRPPDFLALRGGSEDAEVEGIYIQDWGFRGRTFWNANKRKWQNSVVINQDNRSTARSQFGMLEKPGFQNISTSGL